MVGNSEYGKTGVRSGDGQIQNCPAATGYISLTNIIRAMKDSKEIRYKYNLQIVNIPGGSTSS